MSHQRWQKWRGCLQAPARQRGWALCVGAGSSFDLFPSWPDFTSRLMGRDCAQGIAERFGLEAVVQAVKNRNAGRHAAFLGRARTALYGSLLAALPASQRKLVIEALCATSSAQLQRSRWQEYLDVLNGRFSPTTADAMARVVVDLLARRPRWLAPAAILTFNVEPLLYSLINAHWRTAGMPGRQLLDPVTRSLSFRRGSDLPVYFCHGLLPPPHAPRPFGRLTDVSKLVFAEEEYQGVSTNLFSWASVMFLHTVLTRSVVFVGLSFTDPDLRRWLRWAECNRSGETRGRRGGDAGPRHFWIEKRPRDATERRWLQHSISHLGVEMIWLDEWDELESCLRVMLGTATRTRPRPR